MGVGRDLIRQARRAAGLTQAEMARRASTSQSAIAAYESGAKTPTVETLERLLRAAGRRIEGRPTSEGSPRSVRSVRGLRRHRDTIEALAGQHHASNVRVFGSVARGKGRPGSDVDLLVDMDAEASLLDLVRLRRALTEALGIEVDVVASGGLLPRDRAILDEAVPL
jgi:hypothetical protein